MLKLILVLLTAIAVAFANIVVAAVPASAAATTRVSAYVPGGETYWKSQQGFVYASVYTGTPSTTVKEGQVEFTFPGGTHRAEIDRYGGDVKLPISMLDGLGEITVTATYLGTTDYARSSTSTTFTIKPDEVDIANTPIIYDPLTRTSEIELVGKYSRLPVPDGNLVAMGHIYEAGSGRIVNGKTTLNWSSSQHPKSERFDGTGTWGSWSYRTGAMRSTTFKDPSFFYNVPFKIAGVPEVALSLDTSTVTKTAVYGAPIRINATVRDRYGAVSGRTVYFEAGDIKTSGVSQADGAVAFQAETFTPSIDVTSARVWIENEKGALLSEKSVSLSIAPATVETNLSAAVLNDGRALEVIYDGYPQDVPVEGSAKVLLEGEEIATAPLERLELEHGPAVRSTIDLAGVSGKTGLLSVELVDAVNVVSQTASVNLVQASHDVALSVVDQDGKAVSSVVGGKSATLRAQVSSAEARIEGYTVQFKQGNSLLGAPVPIDSETGRATKGHVFSSSANNGKNVAFSAELVAPSGVSVQSFATVLVAQKTPPPTLTSLKVSVDGTRRVGRTLTAVATGNIKPSSYKYQWYVNGVAIKGATSKTYKIHSSRVGKRLSVKVTASRSGSSVVKVSGRTGTIAKAVTTLKVSSTKTVSLKKTATVKVSVSATGITSSRGTLRVKVGKASVSKVITKPGTHTFKIKGSSIGTGTKTLTATFTPSSSTKKYMSTPSKKTVKVRVVR